MRLVKRQVVGFCLVVIFSCMMMMPFSVVLASEEESVDNFSCHPANRWECTDVDYGDYVENGLLVLNDTGDGSTDYYKMDRGLQSVDDKVEIVFKMDTSGTTTNYYARLYMRLIDPAEGSQWNFYIRDLRNNDYHVSCLVYAHEQNGTNMVVNLTGSDRVYDDTWYKLTYDFDLPKGKFSMKLEFYPNGTDVFDYDYYDLFPDSILKLFGENSLELQIFSSSYDNTIVREDKFLYVDAPFKEREWVQTDTPSDAQWLEDYWDLVHAEDDVNPADTSEWELCVPYLDGFHGTAQIDLETPANMANDDFLKIIVKLVGIDGDDGGEHSIHEVAILSYKSAGVSVTYMVVMEDGVQLKASSTHTGKTSPKMDFTFRLTEDRSVSSVKARFYPDLTQGTYYDFYGECDVSDCVDDLSHEFLICVEYYILMTGDTEVFMEMTGFGMLERDWFQGLLLWLGDAAAGWLGEFFALVFRGLAAIFVVVGELISEAIKALEPLLNAISSAITTMQGIIETAVGLVQTAVEAVGTAVAAIASDLLDLVGSFIDDAIAWLLTIIEDIVILLRDILFWIVNNVPILSDLVGVVDIVVGSGIEILTGLPQWITDAMNVFEFFGLEFVLVFTLTPYVFIYPMRNAQNFIDYLANLIDVLVKNINPLPDPFKLTVPLGLVYIPLMAIVVLGVW